MEKKDSHSPLYLCIACEELRLFGVEVFCIIIIIIYIFIGDILGFFALFWSVCFDSFFIYYYVASFFVGGGILVCASIL